MKNQSLYEASLKALTENGVPEELAQKVSVIIANDEAGLPNLGRTDEDQGLVNKALVHLQNFWRGE